MRTGPFIWPTEALVQPGISEKSQLDDLYSERDSEVDGHSAVPVDWRKGSVQPEGARDAEKGKFGAQPAALTHAAEGVFLFAFRVCGLFQFSLCGPRQSGANPGQHAYETHTRATSPTRPEHAPTIDAADAATVRARPSTASPRTSEA